MKDVWYADNRDLIKWSVLITLAQNHQAKKIIQITYFRPSEFSEIVIDGQSYKLPQQVISHFRDITNIQKMITDFQVEVLMEEFKDRDKYLTTTTDFISSHSVEKCVVFLDPDTGLQPTKTKLNHTHVSNQEIEKIWEHVKIGDIFAFYQHQTNRNGSPWIEEKREQFSRAVNIPLDCVKIAHSQSISKDVVFFYTTKS